MLSRAANRVRAVHSGAWEFNLQRTLGLGFNVGTAFASRVNVRGGDNFFSYNDTVDEDGVTYKETLQLRSVEAKLDLFIAGGFRVTPGVLIYNDNNASATASVPGGQSFSLGGKQYNSSCTNPIAGTAALTLNGAAPTPAIGFGILLARGGRHFSVSTDIGVVFQGSPQFNLALAGDQCVSVGVPPPLAGRSSGGAPTTACFPINTFPDARANIVSEQQKISDDLKPFKYYPELSVMFGWSF